MKSVLRQSLEASGVPRKAVAQAIGRTYNYLATSLDEHDPQQLPASLLVPFMKATNNLEPLRHLAMEMGCAVVELPTGKSCDDAILLKFACVVEELGEDSSVIRQAISDGEISAGESLRVRAEIRDTVEALLSLEQIVMSRVKPEPSRMTLPSQTALSQKAASA